ncbi:MAG: DUF2220 family protein [Spirochaetales bacterium]|nr:DUF2220 family protein [Spirochaetales bacterium]
MTGWEQQIIEAFMERYPSSAAAAGGRALRIRTRQIFSGFEKAPPDDRESFLEAAESLERQKALSLIWAGRRRGETLSTLVCADPEKLFALAGKPFPPVIAEEARLAARKTAGDMSAQAAAQNAAPLFLLLSETLTPEDALRGIDAAAVRDFARLCQNAALFPGLTPRALSVRLYADSKRLETLLDIFSRHMNRARKRCVPVPDFSGLLRAFPETLVAGKLAFISDPASPAPAITNALGLIMGLPLGAILKIRSVRPLEIQPGPPRALFIENLETFYALAENSPRYACLIYAGGHPNNAVRALAETLAADFELHHAGDLDPDGILILQELIRCAGKPILPLCMDAATFARYTGCGKKLEKPILRRLALIREETRAIPGITGLIRKIEETGLGIEQEIIDYSSEVFS